MFLRWRHEVLRWLNALRRDPSPQLRWSSQAEEAEAMKPIVRQYCLITGLYYPFVVADRFFNEHGAALMVMLSVTLAAMMFAVYGWLALRKPTSRRRLLTINLGLNLLLYLNPVAFQLLHFTRDRLIYFLFLIFIYAVTGVSLWAVALSVGVALATLIAFGVLGAGPVSTHSGMLMLIIIPVIVLIFNAIRTSMLQAIRARVLAEGLRNEAQKLADCDALTGLPNRRSFFTAFEAARAAGRGFDLLLVDLDGFKPINDIYGHSVGDALLIDVAARLREVCGEAAAPSRMGGDEFAILTHAAMSDDALEDLSARLCERLRETYLLGGVTANISASLGMVHVDDPGMGASQYLERAVTPSITPSRTCAARRWCSTPAMKPICATSIWSIRPCATAISTANCRSSFSRRSMSRTVVRSVSRRWRAGTASSSARCDPTSSSAPPSVPA